MMPNSYFPHKYLQDLAIFSQGINIPENGPFWMLCGMTAGNFFEPEKVKQYAAPSDFLICLYFLNLLNQGIYTHFREHHINWLSTSAPFVDTLGCSYGHGGWSHSPDSILRFARNPNYIPRAQPIEITATQLKNYTEFFLFEYVDSLFADYPRQAINPDELLKHLQEDPDSYAVLQGIQRPQ